MESNKITAITIAIITLIVGLFSIGGLVEDLESQEVMVIQYPTGTLKAFTEPGWQFQWFGSVQKYNLRKQYTFYHPKKEETNIADTSVKLNFNDGGHADVSGVVSWEIPVDKEQLITVHRKFGSQTAIEQQIIRPTIESAAYTSGPLMSSTESAAEKRNVLLQYMQDQAKHGPYKTKMSAVKVVDPLTEKEKTANIAEIVTKDGQAVREQESSASIFGINLLPMTITDIEYDQTIARQIKDRQEAIQGVQISQANSLKAEQDAITAEKTGQAKAATAKWTQEAIKAQQVTLAEQTAAVARLDAQRDLDVAVLETKRAEQYKQKQILEGMGDAEKKKLIMSANGALDQKLEAYVKVQEAYANAIGAYTGNWVPSVVTGGQSGTNAGSGAQQMIDLLSAKAARDLGIDMSVEGANKTK